MKYCIECGEELEDGAKFCLKCGAAQPEKSGESADEPEMPESAHKEAEQRTVVESKPAKVEPVDEVSKSSTGALDKGVQQLLDEYQRLFTELEKGED
jgi:hypothetical protein